MSDVIVARRRYDAIVRRVAFLLGTVAGIDLKTLAGR
jgi:hypothetical protein